MVCPPAPGHQKHLLGDEVSNNNQKKKERKKMKKKNE